MAGAMWRERPSGTRGCAWSRGAGSVLHRPDTSRWGKGGERVTGGEAVGGAADAGGASVEDVGVDHGGRHVAVPEQLLDGADVVAGFEEVGGEAVAQGVAGDPLGDSAAVAALLTARWMRSGKR